MSPIISNNAILQVSKILSQTQTQNACIFLYDMVYYLGFDIRGAMRRGIEVVITGLTRNQFACKGTQVRILSPPPNKKVPLGVLFYLVETEKRYLFF